MGRGRAKAKQTKVARDLKYSSPNTDLTALQRELAGGGPELRAAPDPPTPVPDDPYSDVFSDDSTYGDEDWAASDR